MAGIFSRFRQIPGPVVLFFTKVIILLIIWKLAYLLILLPKRTLDRPLSHAVAMNTVDALNLLTKHNEFSASPSVYRYVTKDFIAVEDEMDIYYEKGKVLAIADVCNGLELIVLYVGFLICFPAKLSRKLKFMVLGVILIYLINILRCAALVLIAMNHPEYVDISHHFLFTFVVYSFIFWLWYLFSQKKHQQHATASH